jgi:hypothetical protein
MLLLCLAVMNGQAEQRLKLRPPSRCEESPADAGLSCFGANSERLFRLAARHWRPTGVLAVLIVLIHPWRRSSSVSCIARPVLAGLGLLRVLLTLARGGAASVVLAGVHRGLIRGLVGRRPISRGLLPITGLTSLLGSGALVTLLAVANP